MKRIQIFTKIGVTIAISLFCIQLAQSATFQISGVKDWDSLNMRSAPGATHDIIAKIPFDGKNIHITDQQQSVGSTLWRQIIWKSQTGWVNEYYLQPMPDPSITIQANTEKKQQVVALTPEAKKESPVVNKPKETSKGQWVLECGNKSPFWRAIVHPKVLDVNVRGESAGMIPITYEKQHRSRWNTAIKTEIKSTNGSFDADLTIKYAKQCLHTLTDQNVPYRVEANINNERFNGCCKAVKVQ